MGKHSANTPPQSGQTPQQAGDAFDASFAASQARTEAKGGQVPDLPPTDGKFGAGTATAGN